MITNTNSEAYKKGRAHERTDVIVKLMELADELQGRGSDISAGVCRDLAGYFGQGRHVRG